MKRSTDPNLTIVRYHYIYTNVQVYMVRTDVHRTQINTRYTDVHETHICTRDAHMYTVRTNVYQTYTCRRDVRTDVHGTYRCTRHAQMYLIRTDEVERRADAPQQQQRDEKRAGDVAAAA